jgi:hypothetical protein
MRRVLPLAAAIGLAVVGLQPQPAHADCRQEVASLTARLAQITDDAKRHEVGLLLTKAQKDQTAGRSDLCAAAVRHAALVTK